MKKIYLIIALFLLIQISFSQTKKEALMHLEKKEYAVALDIFKQLYVKDTSNFETNYNIGRCYLNLNIDRSIALKHLEWAAKRPKKTENEVFYYLGLAHFHSHHFDLAIEALKKYLTASIKKLQFESEARRYIEMCQNAQLLMESPVNVTFIHLGKEINSDKCEDNPFVTADDKTLVYCSNRRDMLHEIYLSTKNIFSDKWPKGKPISQKLKTLYEAKTAGISADGKTLLIYYSESSPSKDIDISIRKNRKFSSLLNIEKPINTDYSEQGASISKNGSKLFFASDKPGGYGGYDIYMCIKLPNEKWGLPINLGPTVNTEYDDNYPIFTDSLIFSSKGHNSMGGYDLFSAQAIHNEEDGTYQWNNIQNLGYPLNNTYDNKTLSMFDNRYGYIAANRKDSEGDLDIYKIVFNEVQFNPVVYKGSIFEGDSVNNKLVSAYDPDITISVFYKETGEIYGTYSFKKENCSYIISFAPGDYTLEIEGPSYQDYELEISIPHSAPTENERIINKDIYLKKKDKSQLN